MHPETLQKLIEHEVRYFEFAGRCTAHKSFLLLQSDQLPHYYDANHALGLRSGAAGADEVASAAIEALRSLGRRVVVDVDPAAEAQGIGAALRRRGVMPTFADVVWMRLGSLIEPPPSREIEVREVRNEADRQIWVRIVASDSAQDSDGLLWKSVAELESCHQGVRAFIAYLEGVPAAACDLFSAHGWGRVDSVTTLPVYRRRGLAAAVTARAAAESLRMGNEVTYLFAHKNGTAERIYLRQGFEPCATNVFRRHMAAEESTN